MARIRQGTLLDDILRGTVGSDWLLGLLGNDKLYGGVGDDYLSGADGNDRLAGDAGDDNLTGGIGLDSLYGGAGNDWLSGGDDTDYLSGDAGDDTLYGGSGTDTVLGGRGNDWLYGGNDSDKLDGGAGNDQLDGDAGGDQLIGGAGNDDLEGDAGVDQLDGGAGNDTLDGGDDVDADTLNCGVGNDTAYIYQSDVVLGGAGTDLLIGFFEMNASVGMNFIDLANINSKEAATIGYLGARAGQFEKAEVRIWEAEAGCTVKGSSGDDKITASVNQTDGLAIDAGAGDDEIWGGGGNVLTGGVGADVFGLDMDRNEADTITDFETADFIFVQVRWLPRSDNFDLANPLVVGATPAPASTRGQFLYDTDDGMLYYDRDGTGNFAAEHVLTLSNKFALTAAHFAFDF